MNGLTYPPPSALWQHFEFKSILFTAISVSVPTPVISYQITALFTDLILGCKPYRKARVCAFQTLLLSRQSSPLATLNALLRREALTRLFFRSHLAPKAKELPLERVIPRDEASVKNVAVCSLVLLVVTPPVLNMFVIALTIESEQVLSFRQAGFEGLGLAVVENEYSWETVPVPEYCVEYKVAGLARDEVIAGVGICMDMDMDIRQVDD